MHSNNNFEVNETIANTNLILDSTDISNDTAKSDNFSINVLEEKVIDSASKKSNKKEFIKRPKLNREVSGVLILNKPQGITSNKALQIARRIFLAKKGGHTGNLDPLAEGVLPICFGEATKFSQFLFDADKSYRVKIKLGVCTDSGDADGNVIATNPVPSFNVNQLEEVVASFVGKITQVPPMYSAIKVNGKPLYKYARKGIEVERKKREVEIYGINVLACMAEELILDVECSKGTYIRTLAEDIGNKLGCGAHVTGLLRLNAGPFKLSQAISIEELDMLKANKTEVTKALDAPDNTALEIDFKSLDDKLLPTLCLLHDLPKVVLCDVTTHYITLGNPVFVPKVAIPVGRLVALVAKKNGRLLGVGTILDDGRIAPKRLIKLVQS